MKARRVGGGRGPPPGGEPEVPPVARRRDGEMRAQAVEADESSLVKVSASTTASSSSEREGASTSRESQADFITWGAGGERRGLASCGGGWPGVGMGWGGL